LKIIPRSQNSDRAILFSFSDNWIFSHTALVAEISNESTDLHLSNYVMPVSCIIPGSRTDER